MKPDTYPLQALLVTVAGWVNPVSGLVGLPALLETAGRVLVRHGISSRATPGLPASPC